jgi:hypothetical protein
MKSIAIEHDGVQTYVLHGCTQKEQLANGSHCKLVLHTCISILINRIIIAQASGKRDITKIFKQ